MTGDWGRRSKGRIQQEQGLPILSTRFRKLTSTFLHTALLVGEHRDESIAVRRRELRRCDYLISPPSAALTIARMPGPNCNLTMFRRDSIFQLSPKSEGAVLDVLLVPSQPRTAQPVPPAIHIVGYCRHGSILSADWRICHYANYRPCVWVCVIPTSVTARLKSDHATIERPKTRWRSSSYMLDRT